MTGASQTTLAQKLKEYGESDYYPLHMPGHKRRAFGHMPEEVLKMDITEIDGFDNLHQAEGILKKAQEHAARLYGAEETFYLINGSTCGILSAISAALPQGGNILVARNCHKSVYHACYLRNLSISYLYPQIIPEYRICEAITAKQVADALEKAPDIDAVLVVSPTYEGRIADIGAIARVVHEKGIPLIVDEAHGAHLGFAAGFATNSCRQGADLVIHSVHKTLPAMTQTALLHVNGKIIDRDRLKRFLHIYQSSSPSYILMASIENALRQVEEEGRELFGRFLRNWEKMCEELSALKHLSILSPDRKQDVGKLLVSVQKTGLSGQQLYDMLLEEYHLQLEMAAPEYVLAMFTMGDDEEGFVRMTKALLEIDGALALNGGLKENAAFEDVDVLRDVRRLTAGEGLTGEERAEEEPAGAEPAKHAIPFSHAWDQEKEWCLLSECAGKYAGEFMNLYPPGTPLAVPGELIDESLITRIGECLQKGLDVQGVRRSGADFYLSILVK